MLKVIIKSSGLLPWKYFNIKLTIKTSASSLLSWIFTCSNLRMGKLEKCVKSVQS